ncbi:U-box domain-containing protein 2 [Raphanus sativus]|uniref:RING-type E3 ubiquitin transferase n=1 Tax=Raphanus sativus TaxID=3726 RepID=A0A9W3C0I3_RAPSA|nr:U-box domain-containing protein 2 [Raphanus sativus]KAJ4890993.1 U-box domain-containing protein 2 [Raphanus sativus]
MEGESRLRVLLDNISSYLSILSSTDKLSSNPGHKYYTRGEEIAKLLMPFLDNLVVSNASPNELLSKGFEELSQYLDELRENFESWKPLSSRIFYVLRIESLASKLRESSLEVFQLLKLLPVDLVSPSCEDCIELVKLMGREEVSYTIDLALIDQRKGLELTTEVLVKIAESVGLRSNQDILIEGVLLANLKENAEFAENNKEAEFIDGLISLITQMHDYLGNIKQSDSQLPSDFYCPLSLELMTDPVIVGSGQTYERAFIEQWFDMGLMVCPKTRQALSGTSLAPNFTVKAFIANWCESNNVNPPDPMELIHSTQPFPLLVGSGSSGYLPLPVMDDTLKCNHIESVAATKWEELRQVLTRSASAPGIVSEMASKDKRSTNVVAAAATSLRRIRDPWIIIPVTIKETESSSSMEAEVKKLIKELESSSLDAQREATSQIRILTRNSIDHRPVFVRCGAINSLVNKLYSKDERIQEDAATCLLNFTLNVNYVITSSEATEPFIHVLKTGNIEAKANVATTLVSLSRTQENKRKIVEAGAIEPLVELMGHGSQAAKKDAATALFNLLQRNREKEKVIKAGGIRYLVKMMDPAGGLVERAVVVLANLANVPQAKMEIRDEGGIPLLVELVELGSPRGKENAAAALCLLCMDSSRFCNTVIREGAIPPLVALTRSGTARAKEKAKSLLKYFEAVKQENQENQRRS